MFVYLQGLSHAKCGKLFGSAKDTGGVDAKKSFHSLNIMIRRVYPPKKFFPLAWMHFPVLQTAVLSDEAT